jgi:glyoxylase-like metal-dependent hydrolase (beta-lactamase superfamily II)
MFFRQFAASDATLSYLFGCGSCHVAIAVDPVLGDEDRFIAEAAHHDVKITHVIDTHLHADHYSGARALAARTGAVYALHESNIGHVGYEFEPLHDAQRLVVGNVVVEIMHTPGHTDDSICLLVSDLRRAQEPWFVVTGDTLFVGAVGRPDLAGQEREMAGVLYDSLHQKLLWLPGEVEVYPGHQAGSACGAGISGKPASTIGFERRWNPMLALDRAAFIDSLTAMIAPRPVEMATIVAANLGR